MRTKTILLICFSIIAGALLAQTTEKRPTENNKVKIHIEKVVNGKKTVIDTTFSSTEDMAYKTFMDENEMKVEVIEGNGKDGKAIKKEVIVKYDDKKGSKEKKVMIINPDGPVPPLPPMPPGVDGEAQAFNFNWTDEDGVKHESSGSGEKVIKIRRMGDEKEFHFEMPNIDQYLNDGKSSKQSKRNKKAKKRIIIIEEY